MRKISASYVFTLAGSPLKNGIVVLDSDGTIVEVIDTKGRASEIQGLEHYSGVLTPGFINACVDLDGSVAPLAFPYGLCKIPFEQQEAQLKAHAFLSEQRLSAARQADRILFRTGCSVVVDISTNPLFISMKKNSPIEYVDFPTDGAFQQVCPRTLAYQNPSFDFERTLSEFSDKLLLGTHSLATNTSLQLLDELIFIQQYSPFTLEHTLPWVCSQAAQALLVEARFGTLEPGKKPGLVLISGVDFQNFRLLPHARAARLV
jgi:cytosine/adenosine deaminase-related metal-dependent hydrolase